MTRLVVVSNRVADLENASQSGGLAVALADALRERGGIWFGWDGEVVPAGTRVPPNVTTYGNVTTITLPLTRKDYNQFYVGYSNSVLWPVFHYRLDLANHESSFPDRLQARQFQVCRCTIAHAERGRHHLDPRLSPHPAGRRAAQARAQTKDRLLPPYSVSLARDLRCNAGLRMAGAAVFVLRPDRFSDFHRR